MSEAVPRARRLLPPVVLLLAAALVATGLGVVAAAWSPSRDAFVVRDGTTLQVDGEEFRFVGFNLYDAAASDIYSCLPSTRLDDAGLDDAMREVRAAGGTVLRFWAYQTYTAGGTDFSGVDRVLAAARDHGLRVMPVLEDGPGNCSTGASAVPLDDTANPGWYADGYRVPLGSADVSYRDYVARIAAHYRDDPTIVAWSLVNEAETRDRDAEGDSVLVDFARDVAAVVRREDPHHLITLGTQANGAPGASGADFTAVYSLDDLDLTEVHDWGYWGSDTEAMPGADADGGLPDPESCRTLDAPVACSFALADELGKPIVVGEAGIRAGSTPKRERRADLLGAKVDAAFDAGASGYLVWQLNVANTDHYGVLLGTDDPLYGVLRSAADRWVSRRTGPRQGPAGSRAGTPPGPGPRRGGRSARPAGRRGRSASGRAR